MKITNIRVTQRLNLGDFQHRELELNGVVDEDESDSAAINRITAKVVWHLHRPERELEYKKQSAILADKKSDEKALEHAKRYVARFDEAKAEIEGV